MAASPARETWTATLLLAPPATEPLAGLSVSQLPPLAVPIEAVQFKVPPPALVIWICWSTGLTPPLAAWKLSWFVDTCGAGIDVLVGVLVIVGVAVIVGVFVGVPVIVAVGEGVAAMVAGSEGDGDAVGSPPEGGG